MTQRPLTSMIGGSTRVRQHLANALEIGRKVTARVIWQCGDGDEDRPCWIHCTPLLGASDVIGVWMVILVETDEVDTEEVKQPPKAVEDQESLLESTYNAAVIPWDPRISAKSEPSLLSDGETRVRSQSSEQNSIESWRSASYGTKGRRDLGEVASAHGSTRTRVSSYGNPLSAGHMNEEVPNSPLRDEMQPKTRRPGHTLQPATASKFPINLPGPEHDQDINTRKPVGRRTYKSLSPYGVLFQN